MNNHTTEHCELCGVPHDTTPITFEEAVIGGAVLCMLTKKVDEEAEKRFQALVAQMKADREFGNI